MLDKKTEKLLEFACGKASDKFAILTAEEMLNETGLSLSQEELFNEFNSLNSKGFIRLKYNDGKNFCLAVTDRGKELLERLNLPVQLEIKKKETPPYFLLFLSAFLGGVLGGAILLIAVIF